MKPSPAVYYEHLLISLHDSKQHCWKTTKILPAIFQQELESFTSSLELTAEIDALISQLGLGDDAMTAEEYLRVPDEEETEGEISVEQLIEAVRPVS